MRFRLAPTPSGYLHLGNAFNFLITAALARQYRASVFLRIDDIDHHRLRAEYLEDIFDTLQWLHLHWDEGPKNPADFDARFSQQLRIPQYEACLDELVNSGLVYACTCSRKQMEAVGTKGIYPGHCRNKGLPLNTPNAAWRLFVPAQTVIAVKDELLGNLSVNLADCMGDFVVRTKAGLPSYQITSLCDDIQFGISHIVRGEDLLPSTAAQLYLASLTAPNNFPNTRFYHHALLKNEAGQKLSKSAGDISLKYLRASGAKPRQLMEVFAPELAALERQLGFSLHL